MDQAGKVKDLTHLDLCTGIGGFHLAAEWAGFRTIGFSEIEPYCCKLLAQKWPEIKNYGDIRTADFSGLRGNVTVLSAGVPCQPASLAGKRRGKADDRWLWPAMLNVVRDVEPAWAIFENPPGILTLDEFGGVLSRLGALGYAFRMFGVSANSVGAKHRRQRIFIVGHRNGATFGSECSYGECVYNVESVVANAEKRRIRCGETQRQSGQLTLSGEGAEALADADRARLEEHQPRESGQLPAIERSSGEDLLSFARAVFGLAEPGICGMADGLSNRMDGVDFRIAHLLAGTFQDKAPMPSPLTTRRIPNRSARLKALGNAVVPQQAYPFFAAIAQVEK